MEYSSFVALFLILFHQCSAQPSDDPFGNSDYADYFESTTKPPLLHRNRVKIKSGSPHIINFPGNPSRPPGNPVEPLSQPDIIPSSNDFNPTEISVGLDISNNPNIPFSSETTSLVMEPMNVITSPRPIIIRKRIRSKHPLFSSSLPETSTNPAELIGEEELLTTTTSLPSNSPSPVRTALRRRIKVPRTSSTSSLITIPITTLNILLEATTPISNSAVTSEYEFSNSSVDTTTSQNLLPTTTPRFGSRTPRTTTSRKPFQRTTTLRTTTLRTTTLRSTTLKSTTDFISTTLPEDTDLDYNQNDITAANTEENPTTTKGTTSRFKPRYTTASTTKRLSPFRRTNVTPGDISNHGNKIINSEINPSTASQFDPMNMENTDFTNPETGMTENFNASSVLSTSSTRIFTKPTYIPYKSRSKSSAVISSIPTSKSFARFNRKTSSAASLNINPTAASAFEDTANLGKISTTQSHGRYTKKPSSLSLTTSRTYTRYTKPTLTTSRTTTQFNRFSKRSSSTELPEVLIVTSIVEPMDYSALDNSGNQVVDSIMSTQVVTMPTDEEIADASNGEPEVASVLYDYQ